MSFVRVIFAVWPLVHSRGQPETFVTRKMETGQLMNAHTSAGLDNPPIFIPFPFFNPISTIYAHISFWLGVSPVYLFIFGCCFYENFFIST